jgi:hypothetical protein
MSKCAFQTRSIGIWEVRSERCTDLSSHWFAVFPMRIQDEYLTSFRKDLRREASGSNDELGSAAALGVHVLFAHPRCYRPGVSA